MSKILLVICLVGGINNLYSQIIGEYKINTKTHVYKHYLILELINAKRETIFALSPCYKKDSTGICGQIMESDKIYKFVLLNITVQNDINLETKASFAPGSGFIIGDQYFDFGDFSKVEIFLILNAQCDIILPIDDDLIK